MKLTKLRLYNYRNIKNLEIFPSSDTNLFSGLNGQGKTNILESIYLLGYGKSFRTSTPKDCIQHGQMECRVEGTIEHGSISKDIRVTITQTEKKLFLHGKPAPFEEFVGNLHLLAFTHEHLNVVRGAPADRRAFLDRAMAVLYPGHVGHLALYGRSLKQRNRLLILSREGRATLDESLLESWDESIVKPGARITLNRLHYVEQMKRMLPEELFGAESMKIHYLSAIANEESSVSRIEEMFRQRLRLCRAKDQRTGHTSVGPHRDELKLYVNGKSLVDFGSAGQQRSGLLSLYFSQMEIHKNVHGFYPVVLIDDAEAELDPCRIDTFLKFLSQRTQIFLTSAKDFVLTAIPENTRHFNVKNGTVFTDS